MAKYEVLLTIRPPQGVTADQMGFEMAVDGPSFPLEITEGDDGLVHARCLEIKASGVAAAPEAMRVAQVGLSTSLKRTIPAYAEHGGLLWADVAQATVIAHS